MAKKYNSSLIKIVKGGKILMQYTGETIDSAISKGLQDLSVDRENVEIEVISHGRKGFLGLGKSQQL